MAIDDFADSPEFVRQSKLLHQLYIRGRHTFISVITATPVFRILSPIIRKNITELYVYRLRNYLDLDSVMEEISALADKKTLMELNLMPADEPSSFLYKRLTRKEDMFFMRFDKKLVITDE